MTEFDYELKQNETVNPNKNYMNNSAEAMK